MKQLCLVLFFFMQSSKENIGKEAFLGEIPQEGFIE